MDNSGIGQLIRRLRREKGFTQLALANKMNISDKAISKWERGLGCPDVSLLTQLSEILSVDLEKLLSGRLESGKIYGSNMKNFKFYVCPECKNIITSSSDIGVSCCGKKLKALKPEEESKDEKLSVEISDNDYYITSPHPMEKNHYIMFAALLNEDSVLVRRLYPQWDFQVRFPAVFHGKLLWYCTEHGLFYRDI